MARLENSPLNWNELIDKRIQVFTAFSNAKIKVAKLDLESRFRCGRYEGSLIRDVIKENPAYIEWLIDSTDDKCFDFNKNYFFAEKFINQQHLQLNAIKLEFSQTKQLKEILEIPMYYEMIC